MNVEDYPDEMKITCDICLNQSTIDYPYSWGKLEVMMGGQPAVGHEYWFCPKCTHYMVKEIWKYMDLHRQTRAYKEFLKKNVVNESSCLNNRRYISKLKREKKFTNEPEREKYFD